MKKIRFTDIKELEFSYDENHPPVWHKIIGMTSALKVDDALMITDPETELNNIEVNSLSLKLGEEKDYPSTSSKRDHPPSTAKAG